MLLGMFGIGITELIILAICAGFPVLAVVITVVVVLAMRPKDRPPPE